MRAAKGEGSAFKSGTGYRGYVTVNGKRKYFTAKTKAEAAQKRRELLNRRDKGTLVAGKTPTVATWMRHWLENIVKVRPTTYATDKNIIESSIIPALGSKPLANLTREHIEDWLFSQDLKPSSQRRYLGPLRTALEEAVDRGTIGVNPAARVKLQPLPKPKTTAFSTADRDMILAAATGYNSARWHIGLTFGPRPGEMLGLTWPDFNETAGTITIRHELLYAKGSGLYLQAAAKTAAGTDRVIYLPGHLVDMLKKQRETQMLKMAELGDEWEGWEFEGQPVPLIFTQDNGRPIGARMDTKRWRALLSSAGLSDVRRYQARHTAATHLIEATRGDAAVVADLLGHVDPAFTYRVYVHPLEEKKRHLAESMNAPYPAPYDGAVGEHRSTVEQKDR